VPKPDEGHHDGLRDLLNRLSWRYPVRLSHLTPNYLKELPVCPAAGKFNYHFESLKKPDLYTIYCQGHYHSNLSPDQPSANEHWFTDQPYVENYFKVR
jgi:hypothetical protein